MARSAALPALRDRAAPVPIPREALAAGVLLALAALAPFLLGWLSVAPNRLISPRPVALPLTPPVWAAVAVFLLSALVAAALSGHRIVETGPSDLEDRVATAVAAVLRMVSTPAPD